MTVRDAAAYLGISPETVYLLCRTGRLAHYRLGGRGAGAIRLERDDLDAFKAARRVEPRAESEPESPGSSSRRRVTPDLPPGVRPLRW